MTTISLSLSATAPGTWTGPATRYSYLDTVGAADMFGNPTGDPTSQTRFSLATSGVDLPNEAGEGVYEQQVLDDLQFGTTHLQATAGLVTVTSWTNLYGLLTGAAPGYLQTITADGPWNLIKNLAVTSLSSQAVTISNFVDVQIDTGYDQGPHDIDVEDAKRGGIAVDGNQDDITVHYLSNEYSWSNTFAVTLGHGSNTLSFAPLDPYYASQITPLTPMIFNTAPDQTRLDLVTETGKNVITTLESSDSVHLGTGTNTLNMTDGHNEVWTSGGQDTISITSHRVGDPAAAIDAGSDVLHLGSEAAVVFVDDTTPSTMGQVTVEVTDVASGTSDPGVGIDYGHRLSSGLFQGGDWSHLTIDLKGFAAGSKVEILQQPYGEYSLLTVQDADTEATRRLYLEGSDPALAQLHLVWS